MIYVQTKKLGPGVKDPVRGSTTAAGYDLFAYMDRERMEIQPGETGIIHTGLAMSIPMGFCGKIYARSGMATKRGLRPSTCVSIIDNDYRGEILVGLHNDSDTVQVIHNGDRVAQMTFEAQHDVEFLPADELDDTARGRGGFGSSGK